MALNSHLLNITGAQISHADENVTSPASLSIPLTLAPDESASSLGPGQHPPPGPAPATASPYIERDLEAVRNYSVTPPPSYTESVQVAMVGDSKTQAHTCVSASLALRRGLALNHNDNSSSLFVRVSEQIGTLQLCDAHRDNDSAGRDELSLVLRPVAVYCTTICSPASKHLNCHVNPDNDIYRWGTTEGPIPVGINLSSFESREQKCLVEKCLKIVLQKLNDNNIGPRFRFVKDPRRSAFFISFGGDHPNNYATSFFPGSDPKDWYIYVFKLGLTLSSDQEQFLKDTRGGDIKTAKLQALEQNLIKILAHEMLHIVGVRHCVVDLDQERESYVRFPPDLSDDDNWDPLMNSTLDWEDLSQFDWKPQTLDEICQIYAMKEGKKIESHRIQDVSWRDGAKTRRKIAKMNARCCIPKGRKNARS